MMKSPNSFANEHQNDTYEELVELRGELLAQITKYEKEQSKDKGNWTNFPTPDVMYMMNLQYLARICNFIAKKYNEDFVMGEEK